MINKVIKAAVNSLKIKMPTTNIYPSYDQSVELGQSQVVVGGSSEVAFASGDGKPLAWRVSLTLLAVTYQADDRDGDIRTGIADNCFDWLMETTSLTMAGYKLDAITNVTQLDIVTYGDNFLALPATATLFVSIDNN